MCLQNSIDQFSILILAGGKGSRLGHTNKAFVQLNHKPLLQWIFETVQSFGTEVLISANDELHRYENFDAKLLIDPWDDHRGPLAGIFRGLQTCQSEYLCVLPVDSPFVSYEVIKKLVHSVRQRNLDAGYACTPDNKHFLHSVIRKSCTSELENYLESGQRAVGKFYKTINTKPIYFDLEHPFININTNKDLALANQTLVSNST